MEVFNGSINVEIGVLNSWINDEIGVFKGCIDSEPKVFFLTSLQLQLGFPQERENGRKREE
jgi:hypothetical protein